MTKTIFERVSEKASKRYWKVRHGRDDCTDPLPSEQVESLMAALCEVLEEELADRPRVGFSNLRCGG